MEQKSKNYSQFFMELMTFLKPCPRKVRMNCETENVLRAAMQCFLGKNLTDELSGLRSYCNGTSEQNQRIEAWRIHFRRSKTMQIINYFKKMVDDNLYDTSSDYQVVCAQFCFLKSIQKQLDLARMHQNTHMICRPKHA